MVKGLKVIDKIGSDINLQTSNIKHFNISPEKN